MSNYSEHPVYWINDWFEHEIRMRSIIPPVSDYVTDLSDRTSDDVPIPLFIPSQQSAESVTPWNSDRHNNLPFATYSTLFNKRNDAPYLICGSISYIWYDTDVERLLEIGMLLSQLVRREDFSANDCNEYFATNASIPFDFKTFSLENMGGPSEILDEGGRYAMMLQVYYDCTFEGVSRNEVRIVPTGIAMFD